MRRKDREITSEKRIAEILHKCDCFRLGLTDDSGMAYIVPLNFGYEFSDGTLHIFFHCASEGRKLDLLKKHPDVSFEMDTDHAVAPAAEACGFTFRYSSIMGTGRTEFIEEPERKKHAMNAIMKHYSGRSDWEFEKIIDSTVIVEITSDTFTCKSNIVL